MEDHPGPCPAPEALIAFLHGEADPAVQAHLAACGPCRGRIDEMGTLDEAFRRLPPGAPPDPCPTEEALRRFLAGAEPALDRHLSCCPRCLEMLAALADAASPEPAGLPEGLRLKLEALVPRRPARPATRRLRRLLRRVPEGARVPAWIAAAAAAAILATLAMVLARPAPPPQPPRPTARKETRPAETPRTADAGAFRDLDRRSAERERLERALGELAETRRRFIEEAQAFDTHKREMERLERERQKTEEQLEQARREELRAAEDLARRDARPATAAAVATLERAQGEAYVVAPEGRRPASAGTAVLEGQSLTTIGARSDLALACPDGTRLELRGDAVLTLRPSRLFLARGDLRAEAARRPADRPLEIGTPHATARVLGTALRLQVNASSTRLDVTEGRVRLTRASDGRSADVPAGSFAVAAAGADLAAKPIDDPAVPAVASLSLIDADTGLPVPGYDPIPPGAVLELSRLPRRLNMRADTRPQRVGSVLFALDDNPRFQLQNGLPYSAFGGAAGRWWAWENPKPGPHVLTATPFTEAKAAGAAGRPLTLRFTVRK